MPFGGGGSGAAGITAHVHSSAAGEGGALSSSLTELDTSFLYTRIIVGA